MLNCNAHILTYTREVIDGGDSDAESEIQLCQLDHQGAGALWRGAGEGQDAQAGGAWGL